MKDGLTSGRSPRGAEEIMAEEKSRLRMAGYNLSNLADSDLGGIYRYSHLTLDPPAR